MRKVYINTDTFYFFIERELAEFISYANLSGIDTLE